jgi:hypothetical protein
VLTLGPNHSGVRVEPSLIPPYPAITGLGLPARQPSARLNDSITIRGHHLNGNPVVARFTSARLSEPISVPVPLANVTERAVTLTIPNVPADWVSGPFTVELDVLLAGEPHARRSNGFGLAIAPRMTLPPASVVRNADDSVELTLGVSPRVRPGQIVTLSLGSREAIADALPAPADQLHFRFAELSPGQPPARLRVDGVDSWLIDRTGIPVFDPTQFITVPA